MSTFSHEPDELLRETAWLHSLARSLVSEDAAADLAQDTWLAALRRDWPGGKPSRAWLRSVARNLAAMLHRGNARRQTRERDAARAESQPGSDELVARLEVQSRLTRAVFELDEPSRTIVLLRFQEELSPTTIAQRLELPPGTVRSRLSRAMQQLRGTMGAFANHGDNPADQGLRVALAPLLVWHAGSKQAAVSTGVGTSLTLGSLTMKKAILSVLVVAGLFVGGRLAVDSPGPWRAAPSSETSSAMLRTPEPGPSGAANTPSLRESLPAPRGFGTAPGWWVEGRVRTPGGFGDKPSTVRVSDASGRIRVVVTGKVGADGHLELDVARIFQHPTELVTALQVDIDHPSHLPQRQRIRVDRNLRQAGFRGRRSRLRIEFDLVPATAYVVGRVRIPAGCPSEAVQVAAVKHQVDDTRPEEVVDLTTANAEGEFVLRAIRGNRLFVVAWVNGANELQWTLRPRHVVTTAGDSREIELRLIEGAVIAGQLDGPGNSSHGLLRIAASRDRDSIELTDLGDASEAPGLPGLDEFGMQVADSRPRATRMFPLPVDFTDGAFEHRRVQARVENGRFRIRGLRPNTEYLVGDVKVLQNGHEVPYPGNVVNGCECVAPKQGVQVRLTHDIALLVFTLDGRPLGASYVLYRRKPVGEQSETKRWQVRKLNADGRIGLRMTRESDDGDDGEGKAFEIELQVPGCKTEIVRPKPFCWTRVPLRQCRDSGALAVQIVGDSQRRIEGWGIRIRRKSPGRFGRLGLCREAPFSRRLLGRRTFTGLQAGAYTIEFCPDPSWHIADLFAFHCPASFEVHITPSSTAQHTVQLQPGGFAQIANTDELLRKAKLAGAPVFYRVFDASGARVPMRAVLANPDRPRAPCGLESVASALLPSGLLCRFHPVLVPGVYRLELRNKGGRRIDLPFTIKAGQVTAIAMK